jgi:hypothetical protein
LPAVRDPQLLSSHSGPRTPASRSSKISKPPGVLKEVGGRSWTRRSPTFIRNAKRTTHFGLAGRLFYCLLVVQDSKPRCKLQRLAGGRAIDEGQALAGLTLVNSRAQVNYPLRADVASFCPLPEAITEYPAWRPRAPVIPTKMRWAGSDRVPA